MLTFALVMSARMGIFQETLYKQYGKHSKEALFYNVSFPLPATREPPQGHLSLVWAFISSLKKSSLLKQLLVVLFLGLFSQMFHISFYFPNMKLLDIVCLSQHCLPLPGFLLLSTDIYNHCVYFSQSSEFHSFIYKVRGWKFCDFVSLLTTVFSFVAPVTVPLFGLTMPIMWLYLLINVITQYPTKKNIIISLYHWFEFVNSDIYHLIISCKQPDQVSLFIEQV